MAYYRILNPPIGSAIFVVTIYGKGSCDIFGALLPQGYTPSPRELIAHKTYLINLEIDSEVLDEALICFKDGGYFLYLHASQAILARLELFLLAQGVVKEGVCPDELPRDRALRLARSRYACHLFGSTSAEALRRHIKNCIATGDNKAMAELAVRSEYARLSLQPQSVFLTGPTNAGKSTLFNALSNKELSLVSDRKYTTRDALSCSVILNGLEIDMYDTPGSGNFEDAQQDKQSYTHFETLLDGAELVVRFYPLDQPLPQVLSSNAPPNNDGPKGLLRLFSKLDLATDETKEALPHGAVAFSALTGEGMAELKDALFKALYDARVPKMGETISFSEQQGEIVADLCAKLDANMQQEAMELFEEYEKAF